MGLFSAIGGAIGKGLGWVGGKMRQLGEFGGNVAKRIGEFAPQIGSAVGGLIGNNPVGNFIKGVGDKVGSFASGAGQQIAQGVKDIGSSVAGIGGALTNSGMRGG